MPAAKKNKIKNIFFRTDGNEIIGYRHFNRCFALAKKLKAPAVKIYFICRKSSQELEEKITKAGFNIKFLFDDLLETPYGEIMPQRIRREDAASTMRAIERTAFADLLIVDHYGIDERWERPIRKNAKRIAVIDDLENRKHDCEVLIDFSHTKEFEDENHEGYYEKVLIDDSCLLLSGLSYALIDDEYAKKTPARKLSEVGRVLLNFDSLSKIHIESVLKYLASERFFDINFDIIDRSEDEFLKNICNKYSNFSYYGNFAQIPEKLVNADVYIGSDLFVLEALSRGAAPIIISSDGLLDRSLNAMQDDQMIKYLSPSEFSKQSFSQVIDNVFEDKQWRKHAGMSGKKLIDGKGSAKVAAELLKLK